MKILLVDDDTSILEVLTANLEAKFGLFVIRAQSGKAGQKVLTENPDIEYVISDYNMPDGNGGALFQFTKALNPNIPFLLCTSQKLQDCPEFVNAPPDGYLQKPFLWKDAIKKIQETFKIVPDPRSSGIQYLPVLVASLKRVTSLACDFYVKLSDEKFVKVLKKNDSFSSQDLVRYRSKSITWLYLHPADLDPFLEGLTNSMYSLMLNKALDWDLSYEVLEDAHHTVYETLRNFGFPTKAQELAKQSARLAIKTAMNHPTLASMFTKRQNSSAFFINSHSIFLAHTSCLLAILMKWDSEETLYKIAIASVLHDLSIKDHLNAMLELYLHSHQNLKSFDPEVVSTLKVHPEQSAALAREIKDLPVDVLDMILQHHEQPDGDGFPLGLKSHQIGPLVTLIIIAQDLANYIWLNDSHSTLSQFISDYGQSYASDHFLMILNHLESLAQSQLRNE